MKTYCLVEVLSGPFSSVFSHVKPWKQPSFVTSSCPASKRRSRYSLKFADQRPEYINEVNHLSEQLHIISCGEMHNMTPRCIDQNRSLHLEESKSNFPPDKIQDMLREHHAHAFLKDNCAALPEVRVRLSMALLIGIILTFHTSQQAIAAPEITSRMQSSSFFEDLSDINTGFVSALLLIFFSELGDKTFFIAALLAARNSGIVVFAGTFGALTAMTVISVALGRTFHYVDDIIPFRLGEADFPVDDVAAVCLLVYFGVTTLLDATSGDHLKIKEEQEKAELAISELWGNGVGITAAAGTVISTFFLVFVAEWGDKSFFSTIALAAASSPLGVISGSLAGHALATLLAVLGGSILGTFLSETVIAYIGGTLFLAFAGITLLEIIR